MAKLSAQENAVHGQFVEYGRNAKEWTRKCALLLPEIEKHRIWEKRGFGSLFEYAAKLAGMSRHSVEDALRILRKIEDKPELQKVVEQRGLNAVRPVVATATVKTAEFWAQKAREMSKNTLETYVREFKKGEDFRTSTPGQPEKFLPGEAKKAVIAPRSEKIITMNLEPKIATELEKLKGPGDWNELMKELLQLRKEKLEQQKPEAVQTESRHIPNKIKTYVINKTRGQCSYPDCTKPYKILHHTQRWGLEKTHDPDRLEPLCKAHEQIGHHGLIKNEEQPAENWKILKEATWWDAKRMIDQKVMQYRRPQKG